jgi:hypothetical protein
VQEHVNNQLFTCWVFTFTPDSIIDDRQNTAKHVGLVGHDEHFTTSRQGKYTVQLALNCRAHGKVC